MARPIKEGLDYFPLDTNFYKDRKIKRLVKAQGPIGVLVWVTITSIIFGEKGYYLQYDEDACFDIGDAIAVSEGAVDEIVKACTQAKLFDKTLFDTYGILTSKGIQERYLEIIKQWKRKNELIPEYSLIPKELEINSEEKAVNSEETPKKLEEMRQRKRKKKKGNEKKGNIYSGSPIESTKYVVGGENLEFISEIDGDIDAEENKKVLDCYKSNFMHKGTFVPSAVTEELLEMVKLASSDLVIAAMKLTVQNGATSLAYTKKILKRWSDEGVRTLEDARQHELKFKQRQNANQYNKPTRALEPIPKFKREPQMDEEVDPAEVEAVKARLRAIIGGSHEE